MGGQLCLNNDLPRSLVLRLWCLGFVNCSGQLASTLGADGLVSISPVDYSLSSATCKLTERVDFISRWKANGRS